MSGTEDIPVLHVDDDPGLTALTADMLTEREGGFTVETATSASEGLALLAANDFDCIVSDYQMPGQNGIEFLEALREEYPDLPFILYTGKGSEAVASDAIAAGVTDYLQKESGTSQYTVLANRIRNAVKNRRHQERAQATHDRMRQIIDMLPQLVFAKDEAGEFLLANEATAEVYGTTVSNLERAKDADFAESEEEVKRFRADDQAVIESGEPKHIPEESLTTADGETRLLETTKIPYNPVETDGDAVLGISMDITERKEREQELRMVRERFEQFAGNVQDAVFFTRHRLLRNPVRESGSGNNLRNYARGGLRRPDGMDPTRPFRRQGRVTRGDGGPAGRNGRVANRTEISYRPSRPWDAVGAGPPQRDSR